MQAPTYLFILFSQNLEEEYSGSDRGLVLLVDFYIRNSLLGRGKHDYNPISINTKYYYR